MDEEDVVKLYKTRLSELHELDRAYFRDHNPTCAERQAFYNRQSLINEIGLELAAINAHEDVLVENPDTFQVLVPNSKGQHTRTELKCRLSHELKNCLHIILGCSQLILPKVSSDHDAEELIDHILTAVDRMNSVIIHSRCRLISRAHVEEPCPKPQAANKKPPASENLPEGQQHSETRCTRS